MKSLGLRIHHEAQSDIDVAYGWYFERSPETADEFLAALRNCLDRIVLRPRSFALNSRRTRRVVMGQFPFSVLFQLKTDEILVVAVAHAKRRPGYWKSRI